MTNCFLELRKIHNPRSLQLLENHIRRSGDSLERCFVESTCSQRSYWDAIQHRIHSLPYYDNHKVRSNAVLAYSLYMTYDKKGRIDIDRWISGNLEWLHESFDCAPDGVSNVLEVACHYTLAPHLHALVVPVDQRGHLCARSFTTGYDAQTELVTAYCQAMWPLGLIVKRTEGL